MSEDAATVRPATAAPRPGASGGGRSVWPGGRPLALFLSHDVDQIHDRGFYRALGDLNHLRRVILRLDPGDAGHCLRRILRALVRPKACRRQFERILEIESAHGWKSTFFFLEGNRWSRYGSRYSLTDPRIERVASLIFGSGCDIGVHGGYHDFNSASGYRRSADRIARAFGVRPSGIRNHYLRFDPGRTWQAQAEAGFVYDATFGWNDRIGPPEGRWFPFLPADPGSASLLGIVVLPLVLMDSTLFSRMRLSRAAALRAIRDTLDTALETGGLVSLSWHNSYFCEPEYELWEDVYIETLRMTAPYAPYCGTGAEIAAWWKARG